MKTLLRTATIIAALALATSASAQQRATTTTTTNAPQIGLGAGLTVGAQTPGRQGGVNGEAASLGYLMFVPINFGQFRVEPFLGWSRLDTDATGKDSDVMLGVGGFFVKPVASQLQLYAGGRLGARWVSHQDPAYGLPGTSKDERRDTLLAVAAGGEYLPIPRVAIGAELQLSYLWVGDTKVTNAGAPSVEGGGGSGSGTQAMVFVRVYLF